MRITMIGSGYVGLVSGACLAEIGHEVTCVDIDENKIKMLEDGRSPIYEPGIEKMIRQNQELGRLFFSSSLEKALKNSEIAFIAVGTPPGEKGEADLKYVKAVAQQIGETAQNDLLVVVKSTVPVGSCQKVEHIIKKQLDRRGSKIKIDVASNPEFLKEGTAIADFMKPDRIVVGFEDGQGESLMRSLYRPFIIDDPNKLLVVERSASEMIKYTANAMLATRISFMNELSRLCEKLHVDVDQVRLGVGSDSRIGKKFLYAGPGFGGSCFPKDVSALIKTALENDCRLGVLESVESANHSQKEYVAQKVKNYFGNLKGMTFCMWGLSFKPGTDDIREAPALTVAKNLLDWGAHIKAHDPQGVENFSRELGEYEAITYKSKAYDALDGADALILMTDWGEYKWPNWDKVADLLKQKIVFDFRNQYDRQELLDKGYHYQGVGR